MDKMRALVDRLNETAYQYYALSQPSISDGEWDALYDALVALERETGVTLPDSPTRGASEALRSPALPSTGTWRAFGRWTRPSPPAR